MKRVGLVVCVLGVIVTMTGCPLLCGGGGLCEIDFVKISENGFSAEDNAIDENDYAWSIEYFVPDGADEGHVYVGTGNSIINLAISGLVSTVIGEVPESVPVGISEIRRYRPDLGDRAWEQVLDGREAPSPLDESVVGFRAMHTFRVPSTGVNYLYALSLNPPALWRTATGEPGSWELVWNAERQGQSRGLEVHDGMLYFGVAFNEGGGFAREAQVWATDGVDVFPVVEEGFGNPNNVLITDLESYAGYLYVGTENPADGYELWRLAGPDPSAAPEAVITEGGGVRQNTAASTLTVFNDHLYLGTLWFPEPPLTLVKPFDILRVDADGTFETLVGRDSLSGIGPGFGNISAVYCWAMEVHDGWLYVGTLDGGIVLSSILRGNFELLPEFAPIVAEIIESFLGEEVDEKLAEKLETGRWDRLVSSGADMWKTQDGVTWYPVTRTGFGNPGNYGVRNMKSVGDTLFVGTANPFDGLEVWSADTPPPAETEETSSK